MRPRLEFSAADRAEAIEVDRTRLVTGPDGIVRAEPSGHTDAIKTALILRSVGYRGRPVPDLPFDDATGTVPHTAGRVSPGVYVTGWIKRGPTGFLGTNRTCAAETVASLIDDPNSGRLEP